MTRHQEPAHITVLGAGFGALSTVRELRRRDAGARITLVAPRAELHYLPGIIWIPSGLRSRADLQAAAAAGNLLGDLQGACPQPPSRSN